MNNDNELPVLICPKHGEITIYFTVFLNTFINESKDHKFCSLCYIEFLSVHVSEVTEKKEV